VTGVTESRPGRVWALVAGQAARRGGRVSPADACVAAVAAVEVTGGWLITAGGKEADHVMWATDEVSELLAELQLTLGEGPGPDALARGGPVLASDLDDLDAVRRWPVFAAAAGQAGAAAVFVFPLQVGAIRAGVMGLYRERPGPLTRRAPSAARSCAQAVDEAVDSAVETSYAQGINNGCPVDDKRILTRSRKGLVLRTAEAVEISHH